MKISHGPLSFDYDGGALRRISLAEVEVIRGMDLTPTAITKDTLNLAIDGGHITKEAACEGAMEGIAACQ